MSSVTPSPVAPKSTTLTRSSSFDLIVRCKAPVPAGRYGIIVALVTMLGLVLPLVTVIELSGEEVVWSPVFVPVEVPEPDGAPTCAAVTE